MLSADQLLSLTLGGKRHQHGTRPRGKNVESGVIARLTDRDMTLRQESRKVAAKALDDNAGGRRGAGRGKLAVVDARAGKDAPAAVGETTVPPRGERGVE